MTFYHYPADIEEKALGVRCTLCLAKPMQPCWNKHEIKKNVHVARMDEYMRQLAKVDNS